MIFAQGPFVSRLNGALIIRYGPIAVFAGGGLLIASYVLDALLSLPDRSGSLFLP